MSDNKVLTGYGWYKFERTYITNISKDYLDGETSWNSWAALRECIQNALDEAQFMAETYGDDILDRIIVQLRSGSVWIQDMGRGVDWEHILLLGRSDKRGTQYRGEKGEGQLMAFLTFAKLGIGIGMFSQDWMAKPRFDKFEGGNNEVLVLDLYRATEGTRNSPRFLECGTVWKIDRTPELEDIVCNIGDYFPEVSRQAQYRQEQERERQYREYDKNRKRERHERERVVRQRSTSSTKVVFAPRKDTNARLYLRGIYVRDLAFGTGTYALFSYNLKDADINRDRSMVDMTQLYEEVAKCLASDDVTCAMRKTYWTEALRKSEAIEFRLVPEVKPLSKQYESWRKAFYSAVGGKKVCLLTDRHIAMDCINEGWNVVDLPPMAARFAGLLGVKTDREAAGFGNEDYKVVKSTVKEEKVLGLVRQVCELLGIKVPDINVVGRILGEDKTLGFAKNGQVYILRQALRGKQIGMEALRIVLHECGHVETGEGDWSRGFTNWFLVQWISSLRMDTNKLQQLKSLLDELEVA